MRTDNDNEEIKETEKPEEAQQRYEVIEDILNVIKPEEHLFSAVNREYWRLYCNFYTVPNYREKLGGSKKYKVNPLNPIPLDRAGERALPHLTYQYFMWPQTARTRERIRLGFEKKIKRSFLTELRQTLYSSWTKDVPTVWYCPMCLADDLRNGEFPGGLLRTAHQIDGSFACTRHGCRLVEIPLENGQRNPFFEFDERFLVDPVEATQEEIAMSEFLENPPNAGRGATMEKLQKRLKELGISLDEAGDVLFERAVVEHSPEHLERYGIGRDSLKQLTVKLKNGNYIHPVEMEVVLKGFNIKL